MKIPVSVIILTKNEASRLEETLSCLSGFDDVWVVDSHSDDDTAAIARKCGARVAEFRWDGAYPKKKQWSLDNLRLRHDWVLMIDADERMSAQLNVEISDLFADDKQPDADGYFITGLYRIAGRVLRHGQKNKKLMLFNRQKLAFPEIADIGFTGGWEVEGHYQPVSKNANSVTISALSATLIHDAFDNLDDLNKRHDNYAEWEAHMTLAGCWPEDPVAWRQRMKQIFRSVPMRGLIIFLYSYIYKLGFFDGKHGLMFARQRARYYFNVSKRLAALKKNKGGHVHA